MADVNINGLGGPLASPAADDLIPVWDTSAGQTLKVRRDVFVGATITGGGTIATGGFTLTVPATGTASLLGTAQTFTAAQTVAPTSGVGLSINMPVGTAVSALSTKYNNTERVAIVAQATASAININSLDNGSGAGPYVYIGRNSNGSTPSAGYLAATNANNTLYNLWVDGAGLFRISTTTPTFGTDTSGTVVGSQSSSLDSKDIIGDPLPIDDVLIAVVAGAAAVRRFVYKNGAFGGEEFSGLVTDFAPRYGMDRDEGHPAGKALNTITVIGDLLQAVANLAERVKRLEEQAQ